MMFSKEYLCPEWIFSDWFTIDAVSRTVDFIVLLC